MPANKPYKVLAVCLGNICRSPLAEGLIQRAADQAGLHWEVASAGTSNWHAGAPPDHRSRAVAKKHGLNIDRQRAQQATTELIDAYDLVLAMDRSNFANLQEIATSDEAKKKIKLLLDYVDLAEENGPDVFDPYWDDSGFEGVYQLLEEAARRLVAKESNPTQ